MSASFLDGEEREVQSKGCGKFKERCIIGYGWGLIYIKGGSGWEKILTGYIQTRLRKTLYSSTHSKVFIEDLLCALY